MRTAAAATLHVGIDIGLRSRSESLAGGVTGIMGGCGEGYAGCPGCPGCGETSGSCDMRMEPFSLILNETDDVLQR